LGPRNCQSLTAADLDNDGTLDLALACEQNGIIQPLVVTHLTTSPKLFSLLGDASVRGNADAIAAADYDNDGDVDLAISTGGGSLTSNAGPLLLFENRSDVGHWLQISLVGIGSNPDAAGSSVFVTSGETTRMRLLGGTFRAKGQDDHVLHFGLGAYGGSSFASVQWPDGEWERFDNLEADQRVLLFQGKGKSIKPPASLVDRQSNQE
jgi:hypothetical protein